jgi:hypothetical protein
VRGAIHVYRVYIVGDHGHFINAVEIDCADDAEATAKAQQLVNGHDVQLWQRGRRLGEIRRDSDPTLKT